MCLSWCAWFLTATFLGCSIGAADEAELGFPYTARVDKRELAPVVTPMGVVRVVVQYATHMRGFGLQRDGSARARPQGM